MSFLSILTATGTTNYTSGTFVKGTWTVLCANIDAFVIIHLEMVSQVSQNPHLLLKCVVLKLGTNGARYVKLYF